uniref:Retrotransposon gag domain-containing protein n=1 Tax=Anopheles melas TaxID=34690 RepID=A0A182TDJ6_9DIPT
MAKPILGNLEPYSLGDSINNYLARLEAYYELNGIGDDKKTAHLLLIGGATLYELASKLCSLKSPKSLAYDRLAHLLRGHLEPVVNVVVERYKFRNLFQQCGEPIGQYIVKLRTAALSCDFNSFLEDALRDQLVVGVADQELRNRLLLEPFLDYMSACIIAQAWDVLE